MKNGATATEKIWIRRKETMKQLIHPATAVTYCLSVFRAVYGAQQAHDDGSSRYGVEVVRCSI